MPRRPHVRPAFSLIEMVTSLAVLSILVLACGSIIRLAANVTGDSAARVATQFKAADATSQIADDLNVATNFTQRTATSATFTVPDRLNTGLPQSVTYSWTGVAGAPLLRQFNNGTATAVLPGVRALNFDYTTRTIGPAPATADQSVFVHDQAFGSLANFTLTDKNWCSQLFYPSLPIGTTSYTLKRVRLRLKSSSHNTVMKVSLRPADGFNRPTTTILAESTVYQSALSPNYEWIDVPFDLAGLNPFQGICVVLSYVAGPISMGSIEVDQSLFNILTGASWSTTTNGGTSWSSGSSMTCAMMTVHAVVP